MKLEARIEAQSAVHGVDLRAGGRLERPTPRRALRLPYQLLGPLVLSVDIVLVISISLLAGVAYELGFVGRHPGTG